MIRHTVLNHNCSGANSETDRCRVNAALLKAALWASLSQALLSIPGTGHAQQPPVSGQIQTISLSPDGEAQVAASAQIQIISRTATATAPDKAAIQPIVSAAKPAVKPTVVATTPKTPRVSDRANDKPTIVTVATATPPIVKAASPTIAAPAEYSLLTADLLNKRAQLSADKGPEAAEYTDALIDPSIAEDPLNYRPSVDGVDRKRGVRNLSLEVRSRRFKVSGNAEAVEDHAIALGYSRETLNYGQFRFDISAFRRNNGREFGREGQNGSVNDLGNILLQQLRMPLSLNLLADNALGVQRLNRTYLNRIGNRSFLRYPLMRGASTRIYNINGDEFTAAYGKIGRYRPGLTTAYQSDSGNAALVSVSKRLGTRWSIGAETWRTADRDEQTDNRRGYGLGTGYDNKDGSNHFSATALGDDSQRRAYTAEAGQTLNRYTQRYGGYYFDKDFQWLSENVQSDAIGGYYNIQYNGGRLRSNASIDWSRFGVGQEVSNSTFIGVGLNYRLNFRNSLAVSGSARNTERNLAGQRDNQDALIRSSFSHQHRNNSNSRLELSQQVSGLSGAGGDVRRSELLYGYSWSNRATQFGLEFGVNYETRQSDSLNTGINVIGNCPWYQARN